MVADASVLDGKRSRLSRRRLENGPDIPAFDKVQKLGSEPSQISVGDKKPNGRAAREVFRLAMIRLGRHLNCNPDSTSGVMRLERDGKVHLFKCIRFCIPEAAGNG